MQFKLRVVQSAQEGSRVAEFFAGIGLSRLGLEQGGANVVWANDFDDDKVSMYEGHFGDEVVNKDIAEITGEDIPDVDIAWSSFPCTDLSLAGNRAGLAGTASGTFFAFTRILGEMGDRKPSVVALENVVGFATSHGGDDISQAIAELNKLGYSVDVMTIDARRFVPQSRPRLFLVGALDVPESVIDPNSELRPDWLQASYGDPSLTMHKAKLQELPAPLTAGLKSIIDTKADWWDAERKQKFVDSLSPLQLERVRELKRGRTLAYRTAYRRTRQGIARWEVRPDDIAGCLRTARGGSSKQAVVKAGRGQLEVRWMSPLEYAKLMGAGEYNLVGARNAQALFGFGDAVCVPVVGWLTENYLIPLAQGKLSATKSELRSVQ